MTGDGSYIGDGTDVQEIPVTQEQVELSRLGDELLNLVSTPGWQTFKEKVLKELQLKAFNEFTKIDPADTAKITQAQWAAKSVDNILAAVDGIIQEGKLIKEQLKAQSTLKEGDDG